MSEHILNIKELKLKKAASDSIQSVIDQYRYFSEFYDIRTQIGALTSFIVILRKAFDTVNNSNKNNRMLRK